MALSAATRERMRAWLARATMILAFTVISFVTLGGVSHNEHWRINTIQVTGESVTPEADIRSVVENELHGNYFFVFARNNSLLFPKQDIENSIISQYPRVQTVQVSYVDTHTISVVVSERKPYALWCGNDIQATSTQAAPCWFIDSNNLVFDQAPIFSDGVYVEMYGSLNPEKPNSPIGESLPSIPFERIKDLIQKMRKEIGTPLRVLFKENGEYEVTMYSSNLYPMLSGVVIRMSADMVPADAVKDLSAAIQEEFPAGTTNYRKLQYIDMRFGSKIFFGF